MPALLMLKPYELCLLMLLASLPAALYCWRRQQQAQRSDTAGFREKRKWQVILFASLMAMLLSLIGLLLTMPK